MIIRPYHGLFNHENTVNVIRHNDECIERNMWVMFRNFIPTLLSDISGIIQPHLPVFDFTKQVFSVLRTNRNEIRAVLGIIISAQSDGSAMSFVFRYARFVHTGTVWEDGGCVNAPVGAILCNRPVWFNVIALLQFFCNSIESQGENMVSPLRVWL